MTAVAVETLRAPGIRFEPLPPPPPEPLPRLDVAALVGFAANGPIDVPVAVEDVVRFHDVFGEDLAVAWDAERGEITYAQLAPAVRAFFRNGGRRCWIVRVAGEGAQANVFLVPGLLSMDAQSGKVSAVRATARSEGAWSDTLAVGTVLSQQPLIPGALSRVEDGWQVDVRAAGARVRAGDLLQFTFPGGLTVFFAVDAVPAVAASNGRPSRRTLTGRELAFRAAALDAIWPHPSRPLPAASLLDGAGDRPIAIRPWRPPAASPPARASAGFFIDTAAAVDIRPGAWIRLHYAAAVGSPPSTDLLLQVDELAGGQTQPVSPPGSGDVTLVKASRGWWVLGSGAATSDTSLRAAAIVSFDLMARDGSGAMAQLSDLGFIEAHARWWGALPDDRTLFAPVDRPSTNPAAALWRDASRPRFPLAGTPSGTTAGPTPMAFHVPLGMPGVIRDDFFQPPFPQAARAHERNGLMGFSPSLFVDRDLASSKSATLADDAFYVKHQSGSPRALEGMHAILDLPDATLVAVPDATHRPWEMPPDGPAPAGAPGLQIAPADPSGRYTVSWTAVPDATAYVLEESSDARFAHATRIRTDARQVDGRGPVPGCQRLFYRVRALMRDTGGPWSATKEGPRVGAAFEPCVAMPLDAPLLQLSTMQRGQQTLTWSGGGPGLRFTLEISSDPGFSASRLLYEGPRTRFALRAADELSYFRVAVDRGRERSPWSNTAYDTAWRPRGGSRRRGSLGALDAAHLPELTAPPIPALDEAAVARLQSVHQALLRLCLARGDLLAALALPAGARAGDAAAYQTRLLAELEAEDERLPAFGAMYHPWPLVRERDDVPLRLVSPIGPAMGVIARRAATSGGWVSPANQPWHGVAALEPDLTGDERERLQRARINVVTQQTRAFTSLSADTLHADVELSEVNLRLLAFLLRRLALRDGMTFAFQPHTHGLRRLIEREFDRVLGDLYMRGAFAGLTRAGAYRIVTDDSLNPLPSIDAGRVVVELRYAPSRPMAFLTIRLVQKGSGALVAEEAAGG